MLKIAIIMLSTIRVDPNCILYKRVHLYSNEKRLKQYIEGCQKCFSFIEKYNFDKYIIDNSTPFSILNKELQDKIIKNNIIYLNNTANNFGKINKGAGLIEAWRDNIDLISKYDYIIHYEPRQQMTEDCVISSFVKNPGNYFKLRDFGKRGVECGFFILNSIDLLKFLQEKGFEYLKNMCLQEISLESVFLSYLRNNSIIFNSVEKLGVDWICYTGNVKKL